MKTTWYIFISVIVFCLGCNSQSKEVFNTNDGAIGGYDPVAYFTEGRPVKGLRNIKYNWAGTDWYFSSLENLTAFEKGPERYAPEYGGYCAYGTAQGHKAPTQPDAWTICDGKLYLNYNLEVMQLWRQHPDSLIKKADSNWDVVKKQKD